MYLFGSIPICLLLMYSRGWSSPAKAAATSRTMTPVGRTDRRGMNSHRWLAAPSSYWLSLGAPQAAAGTETGAGPVLSSANGPEQSSNRLLMSYKWLERWSPRIWPVTVAITFTALIAVLYNLHLTINASRPELASTEAKLYVNAAGNPPEWVSLTWGNIGKRPALRGAVTLFLSARTETGSMRCPLPGPRRRLSRFPSVGGFDLLVRHGVPTRVSGAHHPAWGETTPVGPVPRPRLKRSGTSGQPGPWARVP
jgi:hypothetical protein